MSSRIVDAFRPREGGITALPVIRSAPVRAEPTATDARPTSSEIRPC